MPHVILYSFVKKSEKKSWTPLKNINIITSMNYPTRREMRQIGGGLGGLPSPILHYIVHPFSPYKKGGDLRWQIGGDLSLGGNFLDQLRERRNFKKRDSRNVEMGIK